MNNEERLRAYLKEQVSCLSAKVWQLSDINWEEVPVDIYALTVILRSAIEKADQITENYVKSVEVSKGSGE